jgi:hypothetical protein
MKPGVEYLVSQGLIEFKSIPHEETGSRQVLTLTKNDHCFLTHTQNGGKGRALYHGFFEPREAHHDANLYRLYQKTAAKMETQRGRNHRVVLDYELKKHCYRNLANLGEDPNSAYGKHTIAEGTVSRSFAERLPCPRFESNTPLAMDNWLAWTLNLPPVTPAIEISPRKFGLDFRSTLTPMMCQSSGGFWISELTAEILSL